MRISLLTHNRLIIDLLPTYSGSTAEMKEFPAQGSVYQLHVHRY